MKFFTRLNKLIILGFMIASTTAFAANTTYYVNGATGNDSYNGLYPDSAKATITAAIGVAINGDVIQVAVFNYSEDVLVNKSITINGADFANTVITGGLVITADNVTITELQTNVDSISASGVNNLTLSKVQANNSTAFVAASFTNVTNLTLTNFQVFNNKFYGAKIVGCSNVIMTDCNALQNGTDVTDGAKYGNGISLYSVTTAVLTNTNATNNARHGVSISGAGNSGITITGGYFNNNGTNPQGLDGTGGGINIYASNYSVSGVTINGTLQANDNKTAGILLFSETGSSNISNVNVYGYVTLKGNLGSGMVIYGKSNLINIGATFDRNSISGATGLMVVGRDSLGTDSPTNVTVSNSTFTGYDASLSSYAISLGGTTGGYFRTGSSSVTATSNNNFGTTDNYAIEDLIYHKLDDSALGLVTWVANSIYVPFTLPGQIQTGIDAAPAGYTVYVQSGTYTQDLAISSNITVSAGAPPYAVVQPAAGDCFTVNAPATSAAIHGFTLTPPGGSFGIKNTTASTVDGTNNWWGTVTPASIAALISNTGGGSVTYDPYYGKTSTKSFTNTPTSSPILSFDNSNATVQITNPDNASGTISLGQYPSLPAGLPVVPASLGSAPQVYLNISATGLVNNNFYATIVLDISNIPGFNQTSKAVFYNVDSTRWEAIGGVYDGTAQTFTFETNHFTDFAFATGGTQIYNLKLKSIVTNAGAIVSVPVYLNTNANAPLTQFTGSFVYDTTKLQFIGTNIGTGTLMNSKSWTFFANRYLTTDTVKVVGISLYPTSGTGTETFFKLNFKIIDTNAGSTNISGHQPAFSSNGTYNTFTIAQDTITYGTGSSVVRGDATLDGQVNTDDIFAIIDHLNNVYTLTGQSYINAAASDNDSTAISELDLTYVLYYISNGSWPTTLPPAVPNANVEFTNVRSYNVGTSNLVDLPVMITNTTKNISTMELIVNYSGATYRSFLQDPSTLFSDQVRDVIVDAKDIGSGQVRFLFASANPLETVTTGKLIFDNIGPDPKITTKYRINNEGTFKDGPSYPSTTTGTDNNNALPKTFDVSQNYPNPFNPSTLIRYSIPSSQFVTIKIYNILGQEVKTLISRELTAGTYTTQWNGDNNFGVKVGSGTYIYRVTAGEFVQTKKMILLK